MGLGPSPLTNKTDCVEMGMVPITVWAIGKGRPWHLQGLWLGAGRQSGDHVFSITRSFESGGDKHVHKGLE